MLSTAFAREETTFTTQVLPSFQSGEFGGDVRTDLVYVPLVLGIDHGRNALRVTMPWLSLRSDEPVAFSSGEVIGSPRAGGPGGAAGTTSESGLGDIIVKEEYFFLNGGGPRTPWLSGIARVKLPTANEAEGLGTGETDYGAGLGLTQPLAARWSLMIEAGYIWRGDPDGVDLQNTPWLFAGLQWKPARAASVWAAYDAQASILDSREDIRAVVAGVDYRVTDVVTFKPSVSFGLSDTAEDFGFTIGMSWRWATGG
jgi:hypothetical protein